MRQKQTFPEMHDVMFFWRENEASKRKRFHSISNGEAVVYLTLSRLRRGLCTMSKVESLGRAGASPSEFHPGGKF